MWPKLWRSCPHFALALWFILFLLICTFIMHLDKILLINFGIRNYLINIHIQPERVLSCLLFVLLDEAFPVIRIKSWRRFYSGDHFVWLTMEHLSNLSDIIFFFRNILVDGVVVQVLNYVIWYVLYFINTLSLILRTWNVLPSYFILQILNVFWSNVDFQQFGLYW